jgi:RNA polymerase sigma-32 factor
VKDILTARPHRFLTEDEEKVIVARMLAGDRVARDQLIEAHIPLAAHMARKYAKMGNREDLLQEALLAMLRAAESFDAERGMRFASYAHWWMRTALYRHVMRNVSIVSHPTTTRGKRMFAEQLRNASLQFDAPLDATTPSGRSLMQAIPDRDAPDETELAASIDRQRKSAVVMSAIAGLQPNERAVIERRFFSDQDEQPTMNELALEMGVSRQRIDQIEKRAVSKLAAFLRAKAKQLRAA